MYSKKYFIVNKENMNEKKIEVKFSIEKLKLSERKIFFIPNIETAPSVGIDNKKEILAASTLLNSSTLAAVIVTPDRLTPGIKEKI